MNIVSNCCAGGFLYKILGKQYMNPFIWSGITAPDFIQLVIHFNDINYANIKILPSNIHHSNDIFCVQLDYNILVHFTHYIYSQCDSTPHVVGCDVLYTRPWEMIYSKYISRLQRMIAAGEHPSIIICDNKVDLEWSIDDFRILNNSMPYKCVILSDKDLSSIKFVPNILWIPESGYEHDTMVQKYVRTICNWFGLSKG